MVMTVRVDEPEKSRLEQKAKEHGTSVSELLRRGGLLAADFSPFFDRLLEEFCKRHRLSASLVVENFLLGRLADIEARAQVWGEGPELLPEFQFTATGPLTGDALFTILRAQKVAEQETERVAFLRRKSTDATLTKAESRWLSARTQPEIEDESGDPGGA